MSQITFQPARVFATLGKRKEPPDQRESKKPKEEERGRTDEIHERKMDASPLGRTSPINHSASRTRETEKETKDSAERTKLDSTQGSPASSRKSSQSPHRNLNNQDQHEELPAKEISPKSTSRSHDHPSNPTSHKSNHSIETPLATSNTTQNNKMNTKETSPIPNTNDSTTSTPIKKKAVFGSALQAQAVSGTGFANITTSTTFSELLNSGSEAAKGTAKFSSSNGGSTKNKSAHTDTKANSADDEDGEESASEDEASNVDDSQFMVTGAPLQKIQHSTGEESEECITSTRAKLFCHDAQVNEWKERGVGTIKCLKKIDQDSTRVGKCTR